MSLFGPRHKVTFQLRTLHDDGTSEVTFTIEAEEVPEWDVHEFGQRAKRMHASFIEGWASQSLESQ